MTPRDYEYFDSLNEHYKKWDLATDDILNAEFDYITCDDKYFIFEESISMCSNIFFRDTWVLDNMRSKPHATMQAIIGTDNEVGPYPPCGVTPCRHFAKFVCPF
jgi:hypothetical protein